MAFIVNMLSGLEHIHGGLKTALMWPVLYSECGVWFGTVARWTYDGVEVAFIVYMLSGLEHIHSGFTMVLKWPI